MQNPENCTFFTDSLNFDVPHRANARTHAQAETANRARSRTYGTKAGGLVGVGLLTPGVGEPGA